MVKVRSRGAFVQYDIRFTWPDGSAFRERKNAPVSGRAAALRWAQERERTLIAAGKPAPSASTVPTLAEFWPRVVKDHYRANRKKPSTIDAAELIYRVHLAPALGSKPLDAITTADVAALKGALAARAPKTVNNVLGVLSRVYRCAVAWDVIAVVPCKFGMLKATAAERPWYEVDVYRRLVDGGRKVGPAELVTVLLGGSAGLRRGEIQALKWTDLDLARRLIHVDRGIYRTHEHAPKGNRGRVVPMSAELHAAFTALRPLTQLRGPRVLPGAVEGHPISKQTLALYVRRAQRRAGLEETGHMHVLRHTFCSHLAVAGVAAKAIQELAGHADLATTLRYMHLSPANRSTAMAALSALYDGAATAAKEASG